LRRHRGHDPRSRFGVLPPSGLVVQNRKGCFVPPLVEPGRHSIAVNGMDQHHRVSGSGPFDTRRPPSTPTTLALSLEPLRSLREAADDRVRIIDHEGLFWLSDAQWAVMVPHLPTRIAEHLDGRRTLSGIVYVSSTGTKWTDCPAVYGPRGSTYRRFSRWRHRPFWSAMLKNLFDAGWTEEARALDPVAMTRSRPRRRGLRIDRKWRSPKRQSDRRATR